MGDTNQYQFVLKHKEKLQNRRGNGSRAAVNAG